ncbi:MAG: class I SAM-dependent methyltransferase, partial [archaeon]
MDPYKQASMDAYDLHTSRFDAKFDEHFDESGQYFAREFAKIIIGKKVLDLGSGGGQYSLFFKERGLDVQCVDLSNEMIKLCMKKGLSTTQGDMEEIQYDPHTFDGVWAYCSLLHLRREKISPMIEKIARWLKPSGLFGLALLNNNEPDGFRIEEKYPGTKRWFTYFTPAQVEEM